MKYTSGPWKYRTVDESIGGIDDDNGNVIGQSFDLAIKDPKERNTVRIANAKLMAAAPELLEALKLIVEWQMAIMEGKSTKGYPGTEAVAAINKAEGY